MKEANSLSMRSTLHRLFFIVAKETIFDSGQPGGHLADDWAFESRQECLTMTTHHGGQSAEGHLGQESLQSACDYCSPITQLYSPNP